MASNTKAPSIRPARSRTTMMSSPSSARHEERSELESRKKSAMASDGIGDTAAPPARASRRPPTRRRKAEGADSRRSTTRRVAAAAPDPPQRRREAGVEHEQHDVEKRQRGGNQTDMSRKRGSGSCGSPKAKCRSAHTVYEDERAAGGDSPSGEGIFWQPEESSMSGSATESARTDWNSQAMACRISGKRCLRRRVRSTNGW